MIIFTVPGTPVGKGRPRFARRSAFVTTYTPEKTASYENLVKLKAEEAMVGRDLISGAVAVTILLFITPPTSWSNKKMLQALNHEILPTTKPDIDNVTKQLMDAMTRQGFWKDDVQVVELHCRKIYAQQGYIDVMLHTKGGAK